MYAQDFDQRLPVQLSVDTTNDADKTAVKTAWETYLVPYQKSVQINHCPSDSLSAPLKLTKLGVTLFASYATTMNVQGKSLAEISASANTVLLAENMQLNNVGAGLWFVLQLGKHSFTPDFGVVYEQPDFRHNETGNYLFVDGHVKGLKGPSPKFDGYRVNESGVAVCNLNDPLPR